MAKVSREYLPLSVLGEFPSDWQEATLEEVCRQVTDGTHDSPKQVAEGGYPLVTGRAIKDRKIDFSVTYNISGEEHQRVIDRSKPERDDILFANIGNSIGDLVRVQTDRSFSIKNVALFKPDPLKIFPRYLEYFLLSEQVQGFIKGSTRGSAQPFIGLGSLRGFPVSLPSMDEQYSIGTLLGTLDDRITLLRETNDTLEAIAQVLFKSWFVDFDPVRAKAEGLEPESMDAATSALFPDSFEESELGFLPKGWEVRPVGELVEGIYDGPHATPAESESGPIFLGIKNLTGTRLELANIRHISEDDWSKWTRRVEPAHGDIVFSYEATLGFFAVIPPKVRCCLGRRLALIRPYTENGAGLFWFHQFISAPFQQMLDKHTIQGATVNRIALKAFPSYSVLNPPEALKLAFNELVEPLWATIHSNQAQFKTLTLLRDALLPRLISGQLRLPEAEASIKNMLSEAV